MSNKYYSLSVISNIKLLEKIELFYKFATVYTLDVYHGTAANLVPLILQKGLLARKPQGRFAKGVYLTPAIETSARYAVEGTGKKQAAILQIHLSGKHRVKEVTRDMLDRPEEIYEDYDNPDIEFTRQLLDDMEFVLFGKKTRYSTHSELRDFEKLLDNDIDHANLRGVNVYKYLLGKARDLRLNVNEVKKKMFETINGQYGFMEIAEDGSITYTNDYYSSMHQQVYPKNIPPQAIKFVWLSDVPEGVGLEKMTISSKLLAHEAQSMLDDMRNISGKFYHKTYNKKLEDEEILEIMEDTVESVEGADVFGSFSDVVKELQQAFENKDFDAFKNGMEGLEFGVNESWADDMKGASTTFTKFTPQESLKYIQKSQ